MCPVASTRTNSDVLEPNLTRLDLASELGGYPNAHLICCSDSCSSAEHNYAARHVFTRDFPPRLFRTSLKNIRLVCYHGGGSRVTTKVPDCDIYDIRTMQLAALHWMLLFFVLVRVQAHTPAQEVPSCRRRLSVAEK
eukprot:TRINITY_DN105179_c0_g1_i1.p1 TRINITY_DN105179_c0_g1~~TRINITY_DN105179_c0_g1_i1.p1  ORF type:complete len:137 (+),score=7.42 TRINITY_DN105179_c0_g1_i1:299-709(+)